MKRSDTKIQVSSTIRAEKLFDGCSGQDGAIFGDLMFRFDYKGRCTVYSMGRGERLTEFALDRWEEICPHSNAVCFGADRWDDEDEFPMLYTNIYNNYSSSEDPMEGVCCVYRITRGACGFCSELKQLIRIGFVENYSLWKSAPGRADVRPYGNFAVDAKARRLFALTMRDGDRATRLFEFELPGIRSGEWDCGRGVRVVELREEDILSRFDYAYSNYLQGACCYDGLLYSVEGFDAKTPDDPNLPVMRVVDTIKGEQVAVVNLFAAGLPAEPELIDFWNDTLCCMDCTGGVYRIEFC